MIKVYELQLGAFTHYVITFSWILDALSPLYNQRSPLTNHPSSTKKMHCQIQASFISFRYLKLTHFETTIVLKNHIVLKIVHININ